jgi:hypothetical protein
MIAQDFLERLEVVRPRGNGRWSARCPAHDDQTPSLSVAEGEQAVLLHCFGGCAPEQICRCLGLSLADLFYSRQDENALPRPTRSASQRVGGRATAFRLQLHGFALWLRAESVLGMAHPLDISDWSDKELNIAIEAVAKAYADIERSELLEGVAVNLRARTLRKESIGHAI